MLILELFGYKVQYPLKQILNSKYKPFKIGGFSSQTNKNFNKYKPLYSAYNFKLAVILTQILVARNPNPTEGMCTGTNEMYQYQGNLKRESVVAAILPSRMEVS